MAVAMIHWDDPGPWYGRFHDRVQFEGAARSGIDSLWSYQRPAGRGWIYEVSIAPEGCPRREVRIDFLLDGGARLARVFVDGPARSPHRYHDDDGRLCMWYPHDPVAQRWIFEDGLLALIGQIHVHIIKENIWRELGEWPGAEAPHADPTERKAA